MFVEFKTTITHQIHLGDEGIDKITHDVEIDAGEAISLGTANLMRVVRAGCQAAINSIEDKQPVTTIIEADDE